MPSPSTKLALACAVVAALAPAVAHAGPSVDITLTPLPLTATPSPTVTPPAVATPALPATPTITPRPTSPPWGDGEVVVRFRPSVPTEVRDALSLQAGDGDTEPTELNDTVVVDVSGDVDDKVAWFTAQPQVLWAEPNYPYSATVEPPYGQGDPYFPRQWAIENYGNEGRLFDADIDALESWVVTKGAGMTVAVVDSGVDASHPDLAGKLIEGPNFVPDGHATSADGSGHGTHVAGIIAALENDIGIVGAAPGVKVMALRALDDNGSGTSSTIASAFAYAGKAGVRVVNASLGSSAPSKAVSDAIAAYPNTLFVVAAGNAGRDLDRSSDANYPCQYTLANILCVGATDERDQVASFSNRGASSVDLMAPGNGIVSTAPAGAYRYESGTSMATPFVAAIAAEVLAAFPGQTAAQIKEDLIETVDQPASLAGSSMTGGRLNAARAVGLYSGPDGQRPTMVTGLVATAGVGRADLSWAPTSSIDLALYQVEILQNGHWTQRAIVREETNATSAAITGLTPGVPQSFRVRAIDRSGEEGDASAPVVVTPLATAAEAAKVSTVAGTQSPATAKSAKGIATKSGTGTASAAAKKTVLSAVKRAKAKGRLSGLTFKLALASTVTVSATKLSKTAKVVKAESVVTKRFKFAAGARTVKFGAKGLKLSKGTWKITLKTSTESVSLKVVIR